LIFVQRSRSYTAYEAILVPASVALLAEQLDAGQG
jgi:hypothetical protein